jgi:hypothetical protein
VSANRKAGQPVYRKRRREGGRVPRENQPLIDRELTENPPARKPALRLVPSPDDERKPPTPDPELKGVLDDMRRRYRVQRERIERGPDDKDAA